MSTIAFSFIEILSKHCWIHINACTDHTVRISMTWMRLISLEQYCSFTWYPHLSYTALMSRWSHTARVSRKTGVSFLTWDISVRLKNVYFFLPPLHFHVPMKKVQGIWQNRLNRIIREDCNMKSTRFEYPLSFDNTFYECCSCGQVGHLVVRVIQAPHLCLACRGLQAFHGGPSVPWSQGHLKWKFCSKTLLKLQINEQNHPVCNRSLCGEYTRIDQKRQYVVLYQSLQGLPSLPSCAPCQLCSCSLQVPADLALPFLL